MQTRNQAKAAAAAVVAVTQPVAIVQPAPPPATNATNNATGNSSLRRQDSLGSLSSMSTLTPTSSFVSDTGTDTTQPNGLNLPTISEGDEDGDTNEDDIQTFLGTGLRLPPHVARGGRAMLTPIHSQSERYPAEVFETPRKHGGKFPNKPTEQEERAARWVRDSELAASRGMARLTRNGTLLVPQPDDSFPGPSGHRGVGNLGSAFTSPSSSRVWKNGIPPTKTRVVNPETGEFVDDD
ncbi:hypothetical protein FB451DRAFT_727643 [Mycena latifolia]|nr:hypothetical protein FB451DRAFT_727643 [Mycena latifolia]